MISIQADTVMELRELYDRSRSAATVLKAIVESRGGYSLEWGKQMRAAFNLSLAQIIPIGGWSPDGTGQLDDSRLDSLLVPAIESTRSSWEWECES